MSNSTRKSSSSVLLQTWTCEIWRGHSLSPLAVSLILTIENFLAKNIAIKKKIWWWNCFIRNRSIKHTTTLCVKYKTSWHYLCKCTFIQPAKVGRLLASPIQTFKALGIGLSSWNHALTNFKKVVLMMHEPLAIWDCTIPWWWSWNSSLKPVWFRKFIRLSYHCRKNEHIPLRCITLYW